MESFEKLLLIAPILLFSVIAHEYAHGYAALRQGDPTAYQLGRLTWNPLKHIDPVMTVLLPLMLWYASSGSFLFGAAKPVPVNPRNYRRYKRGDIIVSLAGVATNMAIAVVCTLLIALTGSLGRALPSAAPVLTVMQSMLTFGVFFNLVLIVFNLLPIPPLDGSHVMKYLLPPALALRYQQVGQYGFLILIALLAFGSPLLDWWLLPARVLNGVMLGSVEQFLLRAPAAL